MKHRQNGRAMIGVIVALVIGLLVTMVFVIGPGALGLGSDAPERADGKGSTTVGRAMLSGKDTACQSNLGQVRSAIQIQTDPVEETHPASLNDLGLADEFIHCAVDGELYQYDPATGQVHCPHPGHEKY